MKAKTKPAAAKAAPVKSPLDRGAVTQRSRNPVIQQAFAGLEKQRRAEAKEAKKGKN